MEAYTTFAQVYDMFMDNVPYDEWAEYIIYLLRQHNINKGLVLELGCGTGNITIPMSKHGYEMIGVDISEEMLMIAREKIKEDESSILFLNQNMTSFELYGTVAAVVSVCDSINYIVKEEELLKTFELVNNYLDPEGIFIFDINTKYKYEKILAGNTFAENREECSFIWDNFYDKKERINEYQLSLFLQTEKGLYKKYEELHYQKAYSVKKIKKLIELAGMKFLACYDAFTMNKPNKESERVYFIVQECGKSR